MSVPVPPSFYWAGMAVGIAVIGAFLRSSRREDVSQGVVHLLVCVVGLFAYYSLVVDRTAIHAGDRIFYLSHYLYWILTQPLLFVAVALVALPPLSNPGDRPAASQPVRRTCRSRRRPDQRGAVPGVGPQRERWAWFGLAGAGLASVVWQLWFPVLHQGQLKGGEHLRDYKLLAGLLTGLALAYQVVWLFGEPGLRLWSATTSIRIFLVLDLLSDVGLGVLSLTLIERLSRHVRAQPGETSVAAAARLAEEA